MHEIFYDFFFALTDFDFFEAFDLIDFFSSSVVLYLPFLTLVGIMLFSLVFVLIRWIRGS